MAWGELVPREALVVATVFTARAGVLESLGLQTEEIEVGGHVIGAQVASDPTGLTAVAGVRVAGNVADVQAQVDHRHPDRRGRRDRGAARRLIGREAVGPELRAAGSVSAGRDLLRAGHPATGFREALAAAAAPPQYCPA